MIASKLTQIQKEKIKQLRMEGLGYANVARIIGTDRDTVRNYCRSVNLHGVASAIANNENVPKCVNCGQVLPSIDSRHRKFCCEYCRRIWWNQKSKELQRPTALREQVNCQNCGKPFLAYKSKSRRYCSHDCYIRDRFWRLEDGREPYVSPSK